MINSIILNKWNLVELIRVINKWAVVVARHLMYHFNLTFDLYLYFNHMYFFHICYCTNLIFLALAGQHQGTHSLSFYLFICWL